MTPEQAAQTLELLKLIANQLAIIVGCIVAIAILTAVQAPSKR